MHFGPVAITIGFVLIVATVGYFVNVVRNWRAPTAGMPPNHFLEWLDERKLFGTLMILGFLATLQEILLNADKITTPELTLISTGLGSLGTAIAVIAQANWRESKTDRQNAASQAATIATLANALPAQTQQPPSDSVVTPKPEGQ